jgi:hypothetical protein
MNAPVTILLRETQTLRLSIRNGADVHVASLGRPLDSRSLLFKRREDPRFLTRRGGPSCDVPNGLSVRIMQVSNPNPSTFHLLPIDTDRPVTSC